MILMKCFSVVLYGRMSDYSDTVTDVAANNTLKFRNIKFSDNVRNIASFRSSGRFACEIPGIYFINVNIRSNTFDATNMLRKNDNIIARTASLSTNSIWTSISISAIANLSLNDEIYLTTGKTTHIAELYTTFELFLLV